MPSTVQVRLRACLHHGRLTVADLALWFARSYPTVRNWVQFGVEPRGPRTEKVWAELLALERLIKKRKGFPVPYEIGHHERPAYITKVRNGRDARLPRLHTAR